MQILCVILIVTACVWEIYEAISKYYDFHAVLVFIPYYVSQLDGFTSEHQFVAFMHVPKRTVQNWNNHIQDFSDNDDVINNPWNRMFMNGQKSVLFIVSHNSKTSKREKVHSKLMYLKQLREFHASACDIAELVNAEYSPMLLLCVVKLFTSITHMVHYFVVSFYYPKSNFLL